MTEPRANNPAYDEQHLIALLEEKTPDELTIGEIEAMRAALPHSPELQQVLSRHIQMDHYLADALGRLSLSVDEILARAGTDSPPSRSFFSSTLSFGILFLLAGVVGFLVVRQFASDSEPNAAAVAQAQSKKATEKATTSVQQQQTDEGEPQAAGVTEKPVPPRTDVANQALDSGHETESEPESAKPPAAQTNITAEQKPELEKIQAISLSVDQLLARLNTTGDSDSASNNSTQDKAEQGKATDAGEQDPTNDQGGGLAVWPIGEQNPDVRLFPGSATVKDEEQLAKLRNWFAAVPGANYQFQVNKNEAILQGVARVKAPWHDQMMLRLELNKITGTRIHLWHGQQGVSIYAQQPAPDKTWAAATTTRKAKEAIPKTFALTSTDNGRGWRTGDNGHPGPSRIDIRYEAGEVIVSRGNIKLLSAPLAGFPEEIYLEGRTQLCDLRLLHTAPLHAEPDLKRTVEFDLSTANSSDWTTSLEPNAKLSKLDSGGVQLKVDATSEIQSAAISLPPGGVREIVFEVTDYSPGAGVFIGDNAGTPLAQARFFKVANSKHEQFAVGSPPLADQTIEKSVVFEAGLNGYVGDRVFIKVIATSGRLRFWISSDGQHWAQFGQPQAIATHDVRSVGLLCGPIKKPCSISLLGLNVRRLSLLDEFAPPELVARAPSISASSVSAWLESVLESQPRDTAPEEWRDACVLRTLATGSQTRLAGEIARLFITEKLAQTPDFTEKLKLITAVTYLTDTWSKGEGSLSWTWIEELFSQFGKDRLVQGDSTVFQSLHAPLICLPVWSVDNTKLPLQELGRKELLALVSAQRWSDVQRCSRRLMTYGYLGIPQENKQLALTNSWALASAAIQGAENLVDESITVLDPRWRHPLSIELSKEGFNVLAELEVALANRAYQDACEIVSTTQGAGAFGLLPSGKDASLWSSFPLAVSDKMRRFPEMQVTMREQFGAIGLLRVKKAVVQADQNSLEMATVQFFGTQASSLAHLWLGDRSLAAGDFARAIRHFAQAELDSEPVMKLQIHAHRRFAAALTGVDWGTPVTQAVQMGESEMPAEQFEALVQDTLNKVRIANGQDPNTNLTVASLSSGRNKNAAELLPSPEPAQFSLVQKGTLNPIAGSLPGPASQAALQGGIDWASRCFAPLLDQEVLYFTDGAQVTAWHLSTGQQVWKTSIAGPGGNAQQLGLFSNRPVLANGILVARRRVQQSYGLVALESATGNILWQAAGQKDNAFEFFTVSDPVSRGGEILSLVSEALGKEVLVSLVAHDIETGELIRKESVGIFSQAWQQYQACSIKLYHDSVYAVLGGSILCLSPEGEVRWVRRQAWIAPDVALDWATQAVCPPYIHQQAMYLAPVGTQGLECLEADSGKLLWRQPAMDVQRVIGVSQSILVVQTAAGLVGLDVVDGAFRWEHPIENSLDCFCTTGRGGVTYARSIGARESNKFHPQLVWVDPATGQTTVRSTLWDLISDKPVFGPIFGKGKRLWTLFGQSNQPLNRELLELVANKDSGPVAEKLPLRPQNTNFFSHWANVAPQVNDAAELVLPDWTLLSSDAGLQTGLWPEYQARKNIVSLKPLANEPSRLAKFISIPETGKTVLELEYAASPSGNCTLLVKLGDTSLWRRKVSGPETAGAWQKSEIDLTPFAGQSGWLQIQQPPTGQANGEAYWASAEVKTSP